MTSYQLRCKDIGMDCRFEIKGVPTVAEVLELARLHLKDDHGIVEVTPELMTKVNKAVKLRYEPISEMPEPPTL